MPHKVEKDIFEYCVGEAPYRVCARLLYIGEDVLVAVGGGTHPHVGAVATATMVTGQVETTVHTLPHHRESVVAGRFAQRLSEKLGKSVVVTAGIHIDAATKEDIARLLDHAWQLLERLCEALQ